MSPAGERKERRILEKRYGPCQHMLYVLQPRVFQPVARKGTAGATLDLLLKIE